MITHGIYSSSYYTPYIYSIKYIIYSSWLEEEAIEEKKFTKERKEEKVLLNIFYAELFDLNGSSSF